MRFGVYLPNYGEFADPGRLIELGLLAERAGWDGFFLWDYLVADPDPTTDPWLVLGAVAAQTTTIELGPMVTPLARRELSKVAHEIVSLDALSRGRVILGVGLGASSDFTSFGLDPDARTRGVELTRKLSELRGLLRGGDTGTVLGAPHAARLLPQPVGGRDIPIWVAGRWPAKSPSPFRRAAQYDGMFPVVPGWKPPTTLMEADQYLPLAEMLKGFGAQHPTLVHGGVTSGEDADTDAGRVRRYAAAGVTWWLESFHPERGGLDATAERIEHGPPRS